MFSTLFNLYSYDKKDRITMSPSEIRHNVMGFIEQTGLDLQNLEKPKEQWMRDMKRNRTFCDYTFICAAANFFNRDIFILPVFYEDGWGNGMIPARSNKQNNRTPLYVLYYSDNWFYNGHFQSIRPIEEEPEFED